MILLLLVFLAAFCALVVSVVAGAGAGLVPLLRLIVPVPFIPGALSIGTAARSVSRITMFHQRIRWDIVKRFVPTAFPAAAFGEWLLTLFQPVGRHPPCEPGAQEERRPGPGTSHYGFGLAPICPCDIG